jgi:hypothetical protein
MNHRRISWNVIRFLKFRADTEIFALERSGAICDGSLGAELAGQIA